MREAIVEIRIRLEPDGPQCSSTLTLDREAIQGIVRRAAGRPSREWNYVAEHTSRVVQQALLDWAQKVLPREVQRDVDVLAIGLMNLENIRKEKAT